MFERNLAVAELEPKFLPQHSAACNAMTARRTVWYAGSETHVAELAVLCGDGGGPSAGDDADGGAGAVHVCEPVRSGSHNW